MTTDPTQLEVNVNAEIASVVSVLDLFIKYQALVELIIPGASAYMPIIVKLDAGLKAAQVAIAAVE